MSVIVAVLVGMRVFRPASRRTWWLIIGTLGVAVSANLMWAVAFLFAARGAPFPSFIDWYYFCLYGLLAAGLGAATPRIPDASRWFGVTEVGAVTCAVAVPLWTFVVQGMFDGSTLHGWALATALMYPALDLLILAMTVRLTFVAGLRNRSRLLLAVSATALLIGDVVLLGTLAEGGPPVGGPLSAVAWLSSLLLLGSAALHPAMAGVSVPDPARTSSRPAARAAMYLVPVFGAPAVTAWGLLRPHRGPLVAADVIVPLLLAATLAGLLVLRMGQLAGISARRAAALQAALTRQHLLQQELAHQAGHDPLTGLANRSLLNERLHTAGTDPHRRPVLLLVDLDGFKDVNDTLGLPAGDVVLTNIAERLATALGARDTLARLDGDQYAILQHDGDIDTATQLAHHVLHLVRQPVTAAARQVELTASIGIAPLLPDATAADTLLDADLALHTAKRNGANQLARFHPAMRQLRTHEIRTIEALRHAVHRDELTVHYQPLINVATGTISSVEALLRWTPPGKAAIPPDRFIGLAEQSGLIVPIGAWVLRQACLDALSWHQRTGISVAVNVSGRQLQQPDFVGTVLDVLTDTGLPATALTLEVTETVLAADVADAGAVVHRLQQLRASGVRIAIDDFGTGYSSLSYLRTLPADTLKIDRAFIPAGHTGDPRDVALLTAIVNLGASLGLRTVAEGIETADQAALLQDIDCDVAQGYHYARPMPADELDTALAIATQLLPATRPASP